ncbi:YeiH family protein [Candidatus Foliamicus sp.]
MTSRQAQGSAWASWGLGVGLVVAVALLASYSASWLGVSVLGFEKSPVSAIMLAIIFGMIVCNLVGLQQRAGVGLKFCSTTILRIGIMLLGFRLSLLSAGKFTLVALPFAMVAIAAGLAVVSSAGRRLGLSRSLGGLIAVGTSICGATAIVATAPVIRARESEVSYAIACITVFGIAAMFFYPLLAREFFADSPEMAGLFLGTSIHETAQVAGAGMMYQAQYGAPAALDIATVTKLVRNLCMIAVIPFAGFLFGAAREPGQSGGWRGYLGMVPWFVVGFALCSALRTLGDAGDRAFGVLDPQDWQYAVGLLRETAETLLLLAMAAVGLSSSFAGIRRIGLRPFLLGLLAAAVVGGASFVMISLAAPPLLAMLGY